MRVSSSVVPPTQAMTTSRAMHATTGTHGKRGGAAGSDAIRKRMGQLSGTVFYTTLLNEMQKSTFKTELMHGGRAEEAFQGQLSLEMGQLMGASKRDPVTSALAKATEKRMKAIGGKTETKR